MEITIKPDDVDKLVREAILKSALGEGIAKAVKDLLTPGNGYRATPVEDAIKSYVGKIANEVLAEIYADQIRAEVTKQLAEKVTPQMIEELSSGSIQRMLTAAQSSRY